MKGHSVTEQIFEIVDVEPHHLGSRPIRIYGCGTIGARVATILGGWGVPHLMLCDDDIVEEKNVLGRSAQGYASQDVGWNKIDALRERLISINPGISIDLDPHRLAEKQALNGIVLACVDNMTSRALIRDSCFDSPDVTMLIEARLTDTSGRVFALNPQNPEHQARYSDPELWYTDEEADAGGCRMPLTNPLTAYHGAGIMVGALFAQLRREEGSAEPYINMTRFITVPSFFSEEESWC